MKIKLTSETGWTLIPGNTKTIIAHFKSGASQKMDLVDFLVRRDKSDIVEIDCIGNKDFQPLTD